MQELPPLSSKTGSTTGADVPDAPTDGCDDLPLFAADQDSPDESRVVSATNSADATACGTPNRQGSRPWRLLVVGITLAVVTLVGAVLGRITPPAEGEALVHIPSGAVFQNVVDSLEAHQIVSRPLFLKVYARLRGLDRSVRAGTYRLKRGSRFSDVLAALTTGRVETTAFTFPEGLTTNQLVARIATAAGSSPSTVAQALGADSAHVGWGVPGPGLEGYLFPDTYRFAEGVGPERVITAMIDRYKRYWTPERRERLVALNLSEREAVTLASIVQSEARRTEEMPVISSVFHNRLRIGMRLEADPTVLFALGGHRPRLLFAAIDSVASHPYNTYTQPGLPPGPICSPGAAALDAALHPADTDYLYFVARPNGEHVFTRSLREHNNARIRIRNAARSNS